MTSNRVFGIGFVFLAGFILVVGEQISAPELLGDPGPLLMPRVVAAFMGLLGVVLALTREDAIDDGVTTTGPRGGIVILVLSSVAVMAFVGLFKILGFTISTALYLFVAITILGSREPKNLAINGTVALAISLLIGFLLATVLERPLPGVLL